jgi:error-prone DNA polymerase
MTFMTLEDETGNVNIVVTPEAYERHRKAIRGSSAVLVQGRVQRSSGGAVVRVRAQQVVSIDQQVEVQQRVYEWT